MGIKYLGRKKGRIFKELEREAQKVWDESIIGLEDEIIHTGRLSTVWMLHYKHGFTDDQIEKCLNKIRY